MFVLSRINGKLTYIYIYIYVYGEGAIMSDHVVLVLRQRLIATASEPTDYVTESYYGIVLRNYITEVHRRDIFRQIITADILWQIYYGRYMKAYMYILRQIYSSRHITTDILRQMYINADILRNICIYYGIYIMAETLRQRY